MLLRKVDLFLTMHASNHLAKESYYTFIRKLAKLTAPFATTKTLLLVGIEY